jgi:chromosome partitioning protein
MGRSIAITNQKGGVGKTTTALGLAAGLQANGMTVLLVDMDAQGNASAATGLIIENDMKTVKDLMAHRANPDDYIVQTEMVDIIPSNNSLKDLEKDLIENDAFDILKNVLKPVKDKYDFILIDCPPSINSFTKNALVAADEVIVPVDVSFFAILGLKQLLEEIDQIKRDLNQDLRLRGVLACKFDRRNNLSEQVFEILKANFPDKIFQTVIRVNIDIVKAQIAQVDILRFNAKSAGAEDYLALTQEVINVKKKRHAQG